MTLNKFNSSYIYVSDEAKYGFPDVWEVIEPNDYGFFKGDCESYCLTLKNKVDGFEALELWYCKIDGNGHCVGKLGDKWIDCNFKELRDELPSYYTDVRKYSLIEIWSKKLYGKVFKWLHNYLKK